MAEAGSDASVKRGRGRPRREANTYPSLTDAEVEAICGAVTAKGSPDMLHYMPTRQVPYDEAVARHWTYFYDGRQCKRGHVAPHFVNNVNHCVDCKRTLEDGQDPIGFMAPGIPRPPRTYVKKDPPPATGVPAAAPVLPRPPEPDRLEKQFLTAYADTKDFYAAADRCAVSAAHMQMRLSCSPLFKAAITDLENRLNIVHIPSIDENFAWDEDKVHRLLMVYEDTGDIATARDSIGVTPSQFNKEMRENGEFFARVTETQKHADQILLEKATQLALRGNDKLLQQLLRAKMPEQFGDKLNLNLNGEVRLTNDQLIDSIVRSIVTARRRGEVITVEPEPVRAIAAPTEPAGDGETGEAESFADLL